MTLIKDIMTTEVFTLPTSGTLGEAVEMLRSRRIRHIPIVEDSRLVGIVTDRES
jgi:acetoin utilization protein AcuB